MRGGVCNFDHTLSESCNKYPKFKTKKQCFCGELCGIPDCAFRHKRDEKFSHSKGSHFITSQEARHFYECSVYSVFASGQEDRATSVAFTSGTIPTHYPVSSRGQLMIYSNGLSASYWHSYPEIPKARSILRTLG